MLKTIKNKQRNKIRLNLFLRKFSLEMQKDIIIEVNKKIAPIGNAEGRKNIPVRKKIFPKFKKLLYSYVKFKFFIDCMNNNLLNF